MTPVSGPFAESHGWRLYQSSAFAEAFGALETDVRKLKDERPRDYAAHPKAKLYRRIVDLISEDIPRDHNVAIFQLGNTLGSAHRHWRRAKFLQRFRLFFRFDSTSRIIIYAWVNDENTLRKAGSRSDPYSIFLRRLNEGNPPDDWPELLKDATRTPD